jgi:glycosyltransferase involved in cell wall biosynthesis
MKISVIMPVYLGGYTTWGNNQSASKPEEKFIRAVMSVIHQLHPNNELIIVADGCDKAERIYNDEFSSHPRIHFKKIAKQEPFSGEVRQTGIEIAKGEIICYLDHDDMFGKSHLAIIDENFNTEKYDWVYYNDYVVRNADHSVKEERHNLLALGRIGTSSIAHKRSIGVVWGNGYGHDWNMIAKYLLPKEGIKIPTPQYYVCHIPDGHTDY